MTRYWANALLALASFPFVRPFGFTYSAPSQCGAFTLSWQGGTAPYQVLISPGFDVPRNISIPDSAYSNGIGNFTLTLPIASQKQFLLTMSDATGFGSGGTSALLTVADPLPGANCDITVPKTPFDFQINDALQQCRQYSFTGYDLAAQPVTIYGLIPLGTTFKLNPGLPNGAATYDWKTNIKAGTSVIFTITDALGRSGGSSNVLTVNMSDDSTCINAQSPASTITGNPSSTGAVATGSASPTQGSDTGANGTSSKGGIIAGAIIGAVVLIVVIGTLTWFFCAKKRKTKDTPHTSTMFNSKRTAGEPVDTLPHEPHGALEAGSNYEPEPYVMPTGMSQSHSTHYPPGSAFSDGHSVATDPNQAAPSRMSKFSEAFSGRTNAPNTPARFVLHTDGGELPATGEDEVVELPPQYTSIGGKVVRSPTYRDRHGAGGPNSSSPSGSGSTSAPPGDQPTGPSS